MRRTQRPESLAWQVFRGSAAVQEGLLTPKALRGHGWTRLRYDVYADSRLEQDHRLACQAAALTLPPEAVISGRSAAVLHGVEHAADFVDPVHVTVPPSSAFGPRLGLVVHAGDLDSDDIERLDGLPGTSQLRTAWDLAAWHPLVLAVPIIDVLLREGVLAAADLAHYAAQREGQRGSQRARRAFALADGRAESPPESVLRVRLTLADLPPPMVQFAVVLPNGLVLHPDLAWPEYLVALEYDGQWHAAADQFHRDRRRLNQLAAAGWIVLHVTSERMRRDFGGLLREVRAALHTRGWRP
jgi:hypothetical protein